MKARVSRVAAMQRALFATASSLGLKGVVWNPQRWPEWTAVFTSAPPSESRGIVRRESRGIIYVEVQQQHEVSALRTHFRNTRSALDYAASKLLPQSAREALSLLEP